MSLNLTVSQAIAEIRKRLDEIEELQKLLPVTEVEPLFDLNYPFWGPTVGMNRWMDRNGVVEHDRVRNGLVKVAWLADNGLTCDEIKKHKKVSRFRNVKPYIDEFYQKWTDWRSSQSNS